MKDIVFDAYRQYLNEVPDDDENRHLVAAILTVAKIIDANVEMLVKLSRR